MPHRSLTPVILVSGVDDAALSSAAIALHLGVADALAVRHEIDARHGVLTRTVSDLGGILEREVIHLDHACASCAIREDIVPTLERLASWGRWPTIISVLPVAAEAHQVCRVLATRSPTVARVRVAAVVTALDGERVAADLVGDELLAERGLAISDDDRRGVAEVASAMVEYADVVALTSAPATDEAALVRALARPGVDVVTDPTVLDATALLPGVHRHPASEAWVADVRRGALPPLSQSGVWRLDLCSARPFHPLRFHDELPVLGSGPRRSRGCFWLPTRAATACAWDGAGGQASVGRTHAWGRSKPFTRITVLGLDGDPGAPEVAAAFERSLLTDDEVAARGQVWDESWDGLEPWLGPIDDVV